MSLHKMASKAKNCERCENLMSKPEQLPCDHIFCLRCIEEILSDENFRQNNLRCPKCKNTFTIPLNSRIDQRGYVTDKYAKTFHKVTEVNCSGEVRGMTILGDEMFVISDRKPFILKFGVTSGGRDKPVELSISGFVAAKGMAASAKQSCLYIADWTKSFGGSLWSYKYRKEHDTLQEKLIQQFEGRPCGVAVSPSCDKILVTCMNTLWKTGFIVRYEVKGDEVIRLGNIELPEIVRPRHFLVTPTKKYIICHGWRFHDNQGLTMYHEDVNGNISKNPKVFYGKKGGGRGDQDLDRPMSLALDEDGLVLVVNRNNHRIELMTDNFGLIRHLVTENDGIQYPRSVCLHKETGLMFVGQTGKVLVFKVRDIEPVRKTAQAQLRKRHKQSAVGEREPYN